MRRTTSSIPPCTQVQELDDIARRCAVEAQVAPAAAVALAVRRGSCWHLEVGAAGRVNEETSEPLSPACPFDLASITKPIVVLSAARLEARGRIDWSDPLERWVPEFGGTPLRHATFELLLSHRAGLEPHLELFGPQVSGRSTLLPAAYQRAASAIRPDCQGERPPGGFPPIYSDLGYILAGLMLERASQGPLDDLVEAEVAGPLQLAIGSATWWLRQRHHHPMVPTERVAWRGGDVHGVVHDENAWTLAGHGTAGHAGLFGTAESLVRLGAALVDARAGRSGWLATTVMSRLLQHRPGGTLRLGFDGKSSDGSSAGATAGPETFGHLGFTGTSLWCDPVAGIVTVLLTNRVRPSRSNQRIRKARPLIHEALFLRGMNGSEASSAD